jgi:hypothetical protein
MVAAECASNPPGRELSSGAQFDGRVTDSGRSEPNPLPRLRPPELKR